MSNDCQRQSVFDRLYQDSKRKKNINQPAQYFQRHPAN